MPTGRQAQTTAATRVTPENSASTDIDWMLWRVKARQLDAFLGRELVYFDVSLGEYEILCALRNGAVAQADLRQRTQQSNPSVSRRLQRFEEKGWVTRENAVRDRRSLLAALTPSGRSHLQSADCVLEHAVAALLNSLERAEVHLLAGLYQRIEGFLSAANDLSLNDSKR